MRALIVLLPAALVACGGSSSETPWPVEPYGPALGPSGESAPASSVDNEAEPPPASEPKADAGR